MKSGVTTRGNFAHLVASADKFSEFFGFSEDHVSQGGHLIQAHIVKLAHFSASVVIPYERVIRFVDPFKDCFGHKLNPDASTEKFGHRHLRR